MIKQILYIFLLLMPAFAHSQWVNKWEKVEIPDRFSNNAYLDVYFLPSNPNFGWICGFDSQVSFTNDGGVTWKTVKASDSLTSVQLESIHFVSETVGFTSGGYTAPDELPGAIFRTDDGGATWREISPPLPTSVNIWGCYFYDSDNGYALGGDCFVQYFLRTTNGGESWLIKRFETQVGTKLSDVKVDGATGIGYAISSGLVWKTEDYGENWNVEFETGPKDWHEELAYIGDSFIIPVDQSCAGSMIKGEGGALFTTDAGQTFESLDLAKGNPMYGSFLINERTGWVCGFNRGVYFTCDAGKNWELLNCGIEGNMDDIFFINDTTGWVVGDDVFRTKNVVESNKLLRTDTVRICKGEVVDLVADSSKKFANYNWSNCGFGEAIYSVGGGKYRVFAYNDPCDTAYIYDFVVEYFDSVDPEIQSSITNPLCVGDTIQLSVSGNYKSVLWNTGDTTRSIFITKSNKYIATTLSNDGCYESDTIDVVFNPLPEPNILAATPNNFCIGDSIILESEFSHSNYRWISPDGTTISTEKSIAAKDSGNYYLVAYNDFGCSDTSSAYNVKVRIDSNRISVNYTNSEPFVFDTLVLSKTICKKMEISNTSNSEYLLTNIKLEDKYYFAIAPSQLPILLQPYQTVELDICFAGDSIGSFVDGIEVSDVCKPHFFKINGEVKSFELDLISKCDVPWKFESIRLDKDYVFESSSPFPNPSDGFVSINFMEFDANKPKDVRVFIYDNWGNQITELEKRISEIDYHSNGKLERGIFASKQILEQGVYFIVFRGIENKQAIPIVISR